MLKQKDPSTCQSDSDTSEVIYCAVLISASNEVSLDVTHDENSKS